MVSPGDLEIFRHSLISIVEEMSTTLSRAAYSTNIKTRRDYTCALFDTNLRHIGQWAEAPQHFGAMVSVVPYAIQAREDQFEPGDGILVNDPYFGEMGCVHLPDVMLISPLFYEEEIVGYAANIAHHVDIGGSVPGGIPNDSTELYQEGLIFSGIKAVRDWEMNPEILKLITRNVRRGETRLGDYRAQIGANRTCERRFQDLHERYGTDTIRTYVDELLDYTERRVRAAIEEFPDGRYEAEDWMDNDGITDDMVLLKLTLTVNGDELTIDFTGSNPQNEGPLNCTPAMVFIGTVSVLMAMVGEEVPKNDGFWRPIELIAPRGTMVNPEKDVPIAGGWEVAMRSAELVTRAMADALPEDTIAATKGIIGNVAYGGFDPRVDEPYVYYETIGGGYGAGPNNDGMDGVQTHFQNTANSPIEELESQIPVYVRRYELARDSGGAGRCRGGLGIRRDMEFYGRKATFSLLTDRAKSNPWGLFGGHSGQTARYRLNPDGDDPQTLNSKSTTKLEPGDVASVQTPGGGGYGDPHERDPGSVLEDVRDDKVSIEQARQEYGVVIDPETRSVNRDQTRRLREQSES